MNYARVTPAALRHVPPGRFSAVTLLCVFFLYLPLADGGVFLLLTAVPQLGKVLDPRTDAITSRALYVDAFDLSFVLFFGAVLVGLLGVAIVPRLLNLFIKPGAVYPLYGFHYRIHRAIARMTSVKFFTHLFGDSSFIVYYLRWLGYDLCRGRADRVELRHGGGTRDPVPEYGRQRDDGRRRPVDHQRRLLQHVLPGVPGLDRAAQLPREPHRLSGRRPDRATTACWPPRP